MQPTGFMTIYFFNKRIPYPRISTYRTIIYKYTLCELKHDSFTFNIVNLTYWKKSIRVATTLNNIITQNCFIYLLQFILGQLGQVIVCPAHCLYLPLVSAIDGATGNWFVHTSNDDTNKCLSSGTLSKILFKGHFKKN